MDRGRIGPLVNAVAWKIASSSEVAAESDGDDEACGLVLIIGMDMQLWRG
jgi:hypothetical protein